MRYELEDISGLEVTERDSGDKTKLFAKLFGLSETESLDIFVPAKVSNLLARRLMQYVAEDNSGGAGIESCPDTRCNAEVSDELITGAG